MRTCRRDDSGTAIIEFVWLAIILLVPLLYVVLAAFDTQRAAYAASAAARSAGRAFVTAPDQASGYARAREAVRLA
jgi:Flp pilus assembly protein TadG